jgi:hypothetical protein
MTWARSWGTFSFFLLKCITIYNKISYPYGALLCIIKNWQEYFDDIVVLRNNRTYKAPTKYLGEMYFL